MPALVKKTGLKLKSASSGSSSSSATAIGPSQESAFEHQGALHFLGFSDGPVDVTCDIQCKGCGNLLSFGSSTYTWYCDCHFLKTKQFPMAPTVVIGEDGKDPMQFEEPLPVSPKSSRVQARSTCGVCGKRLGPALNPDELVCTCAPPKLPTCRVCGLPLPPPDFPREKVSSAVCTYSCTCNRK